MQNFQNTAVRQQLGKMSPTERQLFQDGFVSRFIETLNKVGDRRSILNQIGDNPAAREKLNIVLGPQKATQLEAGMRAEGVMDLARKAVQGNSTTARRSRRPACQRIQSMGARPRPRPADRYSRATSPVASRQRNRSTRPAVSRAFFYGRFQSERSGPNRLPSSSIRTASPRREP
jgi:hypothetical protein